MDCWFTEALPFFVNPIAKIDLERRSLALRLQANYEPNAVAVRQSRGISLLSSIEALISPKMFARSLHNYFKVKMFNNSDEESFVKSVWRTVSDFRQLNMLGEIVELGSTVDFFPILWIDSKNGTDVAKLVSRLVALSPYARIVAVFVCSE